MWNDNDGIYSMKGQENWKAKFFWVLSFIVL